MPTDPILFCDDRAYNSFSPSACRRCEAEPNEDICYCLNCGKGQGIFAYEGKHYPRRVDYSDDDNETLFCRYCAHMVVQQKQTELSRPVRDFFIGECEHCRTQMKKLEQEYIARHFCHCHPSAVAVSFCSCGRPICQECWDNCSDLYKDITYSHIKYGKCIDCYNKEVERKEKKQVEIDKWNKKSAIGKFIGNFRGENPW